MAFTRHLSVLLKKYIILNIILPQLQGLFGRRRRRSVFNGEEDLDAVAGYVETLTKGRNTYHAQP